MDNQLNAFFAGFEKVGVRWGRILGASALGTLGIAAATGTEKQLGQAIGGGVNEVTYQTQKAREAVQRGMRDLQAKKLTVYKNIRALGEN